LIVCSWYEYYGGEFSPSNCSYKCEWTSDKGKVEQADVVVFSAYGVDQIAPPSYRDPRQVWAFFSQESPPNVGRGESDLSRWNGLFNWTITYRLDSDVQLRYGKFVQRSHPVANLSFDDVSFSLMM
jgi:hypothetical protein